MKKAINIYGTRICLNCQKKFEASLPSQVTCSEKCRIARRRTLDSQRKKRKRDIFWETLEWLNCRLEDAIAHNKTGVANNNTSPKMLETKEKDKHGNKASAPEKYRHICTNCGIPFKSAYKEDSYCCDECAEESAISSIG